jgi:hypothetical protein
MFGIYSRGSSYAFLVLLEPEALLTRVVWNTHESLLVWVDHDPTQAGLIHTLQAKPLSFRGRSGTG